MWSLRAAAVTSSDTRRVGEALYFFTFNTKHMENVFSFQHNADKINTALGISNELEKKCSEIIYFSAMSNHYISEELFDNRADAPRSLTTMTGDLEKALSLCSNGIERSYLLFIFNHRHDLAIDALAKHKILNEMTGLDRKRAELTMKMMELKIEEKAEELCGDCVLPSEMFKKMEIVQKSRYSFEKYLNLIYANGNFIKKGIVL